MSIGDTARHLSEFQHTKFKYMFSAFFDIEKVKLLYIEYQRWSGDFSKWWLNYEILLNLYFQNGLIEHDDIISFGARMCQYSGWKDGSVQKLRLTDILNTFYECVRDQVKTEYLSKYIKSKWSCIWSHNIGTRAENDTIYHITRHLFWRWKDNRGGMLDSMERSLQSIPRCSV